MDIAEQAILQNNEAAAMLRNGYSSSMVTRQLVHSLQSYKPATNQQSGRAGHHRCCIKESFDQYLVSTFKNRNTRNQSLEERCQSKYFIFSRAIQLPLKVAQSHQSSGMVGAVIVFNLCISHHIAGCNQKSKDKREKLFRKASKLYQLVYRIIINEGDHFESAKVYLLAVANNLGVIHCELQERKEAVRCFEHVISILMLILDTSNDDCRSNKNMEGFLTNASAIVMQNNYVVAPAA